MALTSKISPYDRRWPALFVTAEEQIAKAFGDALANIVGNEPLKREALVSFGARLGCGG